MDVTTVPPGGAWVGQAGRLPTVQRPRRLAEFAGLFATAVRSVARDTLREAVAAGCDDVVAGASRPGCPLPFAELAEGGSHGRA